MLLGILDFEKFLKYGFAGLVAIFAILTYLLFKGQLKEGLSTKDFLLRILPFLLVTMLLLLMAGFSIYTDRQFQKDTAASVYKQTTDSVAIVFKQRVDSLSTRLLICEGSSPSAESSKKKYELIKHLEDSLNNTITLLQKEVSKKSDYLNTNVVLGIANSIEDITNHTSSKGFNAGRQPELLEKMIRNAVFQNILTFGADTAVLRSALTVIQRRGTPVNVNKLIGEAPKLFSLKRRWLGRVIAKLQEATNNLGVAQNNAMISVALPQEVWIVDQPYTINFVDTQLGELGLEKQLLDRKAL